MSVIPSPFPYFGGKSRVAHVTWKAFGDTTNYVEPFGGSLAVLLARENWQGKTETVNELNPYIANFWRATLRDPEQVARYADHPVFEADLHARHRWLIAQTDFKERMLTDPEYYDAKIAGWWVWGICAWIGSGWCDVDSLRQDGTTSERMPHLSDVGTGVHRPARKMRHLSGSGGMGINAPSRQAPRLSAAHGQGIHAPSRQLPELHAGRGVNRRALENSLLPYFTLLHERLRRVRVTCGDWSRVMGESVTTKIGMTAVLLDPPYETGNDLYAVKGNVAADVLEWCKANWTNPLLRIALCGYEGEFAVPTDWTCHAWKQRAGYQSHDKGNAERERIWLSPACLPLTPKAIQSTWLKEESA